MSRVLIQLWIPNKPDQPNPSRCYCTSLFVPYEIVPCWACCRTRMLCVTEWSLACIENNRKLLSGFLAVQRILVQVTGQSRLFVGKTYRLEYYASFNYLLQSTGPLKR